MRLTVLENLLLAASKQRGENVFDNFLRRSKAIAQEKKNLERALSVANIVKLGTLKNEYAANLSGGQKKVLSLGRVLMTEPDLILLDEPTAGVNRTLALQLMDVYAKQ